MYLELFATCDKCGKAQSIKFPVVVRLHKQENEAIPSGTSHKCIHCGHINGYRPIAMPVE